MKNSHGTGPFQENQSFRTVVFGTRLSWMFVSTPPSVIGAPASTWFSSVKTLGTESL